MLNVIFGIILSQKLNMAVGQSRGKGKALESIAARSGRDPAAIIDSIQAAEKAQAKAQAAKKRAAKLEEEKAAKKAAAAAKASSVKSTNGEHNEAGETSSARKYAALPPHEQYRFQCFRRSGFASRPIEKFVAKMLVEETNRRFVTRRGTLAGLGVRKSAGVYNWEDDFGTNVATVTDGSDSDQHVQSNSKKRKKLSKKQILEEESKRRRIAMDQPPPYLLDAFNSGSGSSSASSCGGNVPPLDQLVVPNSASEIVAVVSTLAKSYAQRLVSAARRVADAEEEQTETQTSTKTTSSIPQKPLAPQHLLEAHRYRERVGLDPGFWMADRTASHRTRQTSTTSVGMTEAAALGIEDTTRASFLASIAAQDAYDIAMAKAANKSDGEQIIKMETDNT